MIEKQKYDEMQNALNRIRNTIYDLYPYTMVQTSNHQTFGEIEVAFYIYGAKATRKITVKENELSKSDIDKIENELLEELNGICWMIELSKDKVLN